LIDYFVYKGPVNDISLGPPPQFLRSCLFRIIFNQMSDARFWKYYTFNIQSEGLLMLINSLQYFDQIS
jgi:hypothetical protein